MADEIKTTAAEAPESRNFIHAFIEEDIAQGGQFEGMTVFESVILHSIGNVRYEDERSMTYCTSKQ